MRVRFFGGYNFEADDIKHRDLAWVGYTKGVPMGSDLANAPAAAAPTFLVYALRDPMGAPDLGTVWTDPDFDPALQAFYYARVIAIPTPRWTAYDQARFGEELPDDIPLTVQDRAYTSSIWYSP